MSKTYTIELTEQQAQTLSTACEVLARLGIGQFRYALECMPLAQLWGDGWHDDMNEIGQILSRHTINNVDGWRSSLGIAHEKVSETAKEAWDMHQVIRHRLSWDRATVDGITDGTKRNWSGGMMGVNFDDPFKAALQPLAVMKEVGK